MRKHILVAMTVILVLALATVAMAADPFVGTWKWNPSKTKLPAGSSLMYQSMTLEIEGKDSGLKIVEDGKMVDGQSVRTEGTAKYDGKDYPYSGTTFANTQSLQKIDDTTLDIVLKKDGQEVSRRRAVVSRDGKTITITAKLTSAKGADDRVLILVCDKQ